MVLKNENFAFIDRVGEVGKARTVTALASLVGRPSLGIERGLPVRGFFPTLIKILVAGFANLGT
jgi:hypothetical protein